MTKVRNRPLTDEEIIAEIQNVLNDDHLSHSGKLHGIDFWLKFNSRKLWAEFVPDIRKSLLGRVQDYVSPPPNPAEKEQLQRDQSYVESITASLINGNTVYKSFFENLFIYYSLFRRRYPTNKTKAITEVFIIARKINPNVKLPDERTAIRRFDKMIDQSGLKVKIDGQVVDK